MRHVALAFLLLAGCSETGAGPAVTRTPGTAEPASSAATTGVATASAAPSAAPSAPPSAAASAAPSAAPELEMPPVVDAAGQPLPQTDDEPTVDNPVFQDRMKRLWEAIVNDDPEKVRDFFFPVEAYAQVKAIEKPERDWEYRLWKNFKRDVHNYHKQLGKNRAEAKLVELELRTKPEWMKPGREGNLLGYFRVTRSYIHYENAEGKKRRLDLTSMISWRGHWYVVHLHGFK